MLTDQGAVKIVQVFLHYLETLPASVAQAKTAQASFEAYGLAVQPVKGYTAINYPKFKTMNKSFLSNFNTNKFHTKSACLANHIRFWKEVHRLQETCIFAEHDALCVRPFRNLGYWDLCYLGAQAVVPKHNTFWRPFTLALPGLNSIYDAAYKAPRYLNSNVYLDYKRLPNTVAYALTPSGAAKMLDALDSYGGEQAEFMLNSFNLKISFWWPGIVDYQDNLNTSAGF